MRSCFQDYMAECHRQRTQPCEPFIRHIYDQSIDCDLDNISPAKIRVFAAALCSAGMQKKPHEQRLLSPTTATSVPGSRPPIRKTAAPDVLKGKLPKKTDDDDKGSSKAIMQMDNSQLVRIALRYGMEQSEAKTQTAKPDSHSRRRGLPLGGGPVGTRVSPRISAAHSIVAPQERSTLHLLMSGVQRISQMSTRCLTEVRLCGLPLHDNNNSSSSSSRNIPRGGGDLRECVGRLMQTLSSLPNLAILDFSHSPLSPALLSLLVKPPAPRAAPTAAASSASLGSREYTHAVLPSLRELHLSHCSLPDGPLMARTLQSVILCGQRGVAAAAWQASLRQNNNNNSANCGGGGSGSSERNSAHDGANKGLRRLDVSCNSLGDTVLKALARTLQDDTSLSFLDFSSNSATVASICPFVLHVMLRDDRSQQTALQSVDFSHNCAFTKERAGGDGDVFATGPIGCGFQCVHYSAEQLLFIRGSDGDTRQRNEPFRHLNPKQSKQQQQQPEAENEASCEVTVVFPLVDTTTHAIAAGPNSEATAKKAAVEAKGKERETPNLTAKVPSGNDGVASPHIGGGSGDDAPGKTENYSASTLPTQQQQQQYQQRSCGYPPFPFYYPYSYAYPPPPPSAPSPAPAAAGNASPPPPCGCHCGGAAAGTAIFIVPSAHIAPVGGITPPAPMPTPMMAQMPLPPQPVNTRSDGAVELLLEMLTGSNRHRRHKPKRNADAEKAKDVDDDEEGGGGGGGGGGMAAASPEDDATDTVERDLHDETDGDDAGEAGRQDEKESPEEMTPARINNDSGPFDSALVETPRPPAQEDGENEAEAAREGSDGAEVEEEGEFVMDDDFTEESEEDEEERDRLRELARQAATNNEQLFLLALVARLEGQENTYTEKLEEQFQTIKKQLHELRMDLTGRIFKANREQQKMHAETLEKAQQLIEEKLGKKTATQGSEGAEDLVGEEEEEANLSPEGKLSAQLMSLIQTGMKQMEAQLALDSDDGKSGGDGDSKKKGALVDSSPSGSGGEKESREDFLKSANSRLRELGW